MKIAIASDLCPRMRNESLFIEKKFSYDLKNLFMDYEYVIANMECPLITHRDPIRKIGANIGVSVECAQGIKDIGIDLMTLANNHIMDHGISGLESTIEFLKNVGIETLGAGRNLEEAVQPFRKRFEHNEIMVFTFAEKEFNAAGKIKPGASPLDINLIVRQLIAAPKDVFKIVILHGGNEFYPLPNPWLRDTCRLIVELGADVVVVQHTHCIGTYEEYQNSLILYGQGNFIFDKTPPYNRDSWELGVLFVFEIEENKMLSYRFVPYRQGYEYEALRLATETETKNVLQSMEQRSEIVRSENALEAEWEKNCSKKKKAFQSQLFAYGKFLSRLHWRFNIADRKPKNKIMNIGNILRCQSHYEILKTIYSQENTTQD